MKVVPVTRPFALDICTWQYPAPYNCYDMTAADPDKLLMPASGFFALLRDDALAGFRSFGEDGRVPGWEYDDDALDTGVLFGQTWSGRASGGARSRPGSRSVEPASLRLPTA